MKWTVTLIVALLVCALPACQAPRGQTAGNEPSEKPVEPVPPSKYFVLQHAEGPNWPADAGEGRPKGVGEHVAYFQEQLKAGKVAMGGPFLGERGGMMVLNVATREEAEKIAQDDPAIKSGLLAVRVRHWLVPFKE